MRFLPVKIGFGVFAASVLLLSMARAQTTTRVSVDSGGVQGNFPSGGELYGTRAVAISQDGRFVAFESTATNLVPGDTNGVTDIFVHDRQTGLTTRVSVDSAGGQANGESHSPSISSDGRFVAFSSRASNLYPGDSNGASDVFVHDRQSGATSCASLDAGGYVGNAESVLPSMTPDGRFVAFVSDAYTLWSGDSNSCADVFVRDMQTQSTALVSVNSSGAQGNQPSRWYGSPSISPDGRYVAFESFATNLVAGDTNATVKIFLRDRVAGTTSCASVSSSGVIADRASERPSVSADGRYVAFQSDCDSLVPADPGNTDIFVHDFQSGTTIRVTANSGGSGGGPSYFPALTPDGRFVAFESFSANLVSGDVNGVEDVFVSDIQSGTTRVASVNSLGFQGNGLSLMAAISVDGRFVAFASDASNLVEGDSNAARDVFVIDRTCTGAISSYCSAKANSLGCLPSISALGLPSQSGPDNFYVTASNVRNNKLGMMLWSLAQDSRPFFGGTLCLHSPIKRTPGMNSGGSPSGQDCSGTYAYHFTQTYMLQQLLGADTTIFAQFWCRDPGFLPPNNVGLTNGLRFTICP